MAKLFDRVGMTTATTGTGTITLGSAITDATNGNLVTFATAGAANLDVVSYLITDGNAWELGTGTYTTSGTTLSRTLVKSSSGSLLTLSGSAKVYSAPVTTDIKTPNLTEYTTTTPTAPTDGSLLFSRKRAGRNRLAQIGSSGPWSELQRQIATHKLVYSLPQAAATSIASVGAAGPTASGTATSRFQTFTTLLNSTIRLGYAPASAAANQPTGWALNGNTSSWVIGSSSSFGGFDYICRFGFATFTSGNRGFFGMAAANWTSGDPSALTQIIGVGFDSADTTFQIMTNDGTGTATKTNTSITVAQSELYEVRVYCPAGSASVYVSLEKLDNNTLYEATVSADLPTNTQALVPLVKSNTGVSATTGAAIDIVGAYIASEI